MSVPPKITEIESPIRNLAFLLPGDLETLTGGYIYDRHLVAGLRPLGWRVNVFSLDASFPEPTDEALGRAQQVLETLKDGSIVILDSLVLGGLAPILSEEAKRLNFLALIHHPVAMERGLGNEQREKVELAEKTALKSVLGVVVTSNWTAREILRFGVAPERIRVARPGVERIKAQIPRTVKNYTNFEGLRFLCVATLTARKGHEILLDALSLVCDRSWHLYCVGNQDHDETTTQSLFKQIQRLGLESRISLLGEISQTELERQYLMSDVFVLASYLEGYGMALAEAIAAGIPVIATRVGAIPETVPNNAGILVPPGDRIALANALSKVMDNPKIREELSDNAATFSDSMPTWEDTSREFSTAIKDLIKAS